VLEAAVSQPVIVYTVIPTTTTRAPFSWALLRLAHLSVCPFVCLSVHLFIRLFVCLSVCLSVCLPTVQVQQRLVTFHLTSPMCRFVSKTVPCTILCQPPSQTNQPTNQSAHTPLVLTEVGSTLLWYLPRWPPSVLTGNLVD
jgi:hypothetical protein